MDLTTSILTATGTPVPSDARLEGINLVPILQKHAPPVERTLFWRTAGPSPVNTNQKAVLSGDWTLIIDGAVTRTFLFDVKADPGERQHWFARRPDVVQRLQRLLADWERDVDAEAPRPARVSDASVVHFGIPTYATGHEAPPPDWPARLATCHDLDPISAPSDGGRPAARC